jgi:tRNA (guanine37-N1)-methyltransferase
VSTQYTIGVGVPYKDAEKVRILLAKSNLLYNDKKPLKKNRLIFFPIKNSELINKLLQDIDYQIRECVFLKRTQTASFGEIIKNEFPDLNFNEITTKFDQLGEIAVLKIDPTKTTFHFRQRIGELILSQFPRINTVLNKSDIIDKTERIFPIEYLAGVKKTQTLHREYGLSIFIDLKHAYFNPRLAEEHNRIASIINKSEKILDLFTGVGPFALHCAHKVRCKVVAVDINPYAIYALKKSIKQNKLLGTVSPIIGDSRYVFRIKKYFNRVIINLPQSSIEYLPYVTTLLENSGIITFYQFIHKSKNPKSDIKKLIAAKMTNVNSYKELSIKIGREVSPSKVQMNVDIQII